MARKLHASQRNTAVTVLAEDFVQNTSGCLLRALRELKRVDEILQVPKGLDIVFCCCLGPQGCSAFWANMDGTVQKLAQMKDQCLLEIAECDCL